MIWHVFKLDDPETWPEIDCPILVCQYVADWPETYWWNKDKHTFENDYREKKFGKCFYAYIGYLPYIEKECHPIKCGHENRFCPHGYDDDGYCMCDEDFECEFKRTMVEYVLGMKRIWKKFN